MSEVKLRYGLDSPFDVGIYHMLTINQWKMWFIYFLGFIGSLSQKKGFIGSILKKKKKKKKFHRIC